MTFQPVGSLASSVLAKAQEQRMNRSVYQEMKRILGLMERVKDKAPEEQIMIIRSHVATTAQMAAAETRVGG